ncbi:uncharacterized protein LOC134861541 isoform X2 [Eleginops maclovinus]|uniref:uncharacterized protein LOC134861541 isoform X2 n=1 Tax=Eleginops maclovinus TaxID=56733 RepID=UPI003080FC8D
MMAAAGCGSATAAAVGGQGGTATARGRFPGRPWSSRSRLRSEKRWQLGRSGSEADDVTNGGPRPANLVLSLNEDQSHLRLLGIEAGHQTLGQAGYSSSGSEEGDDFRGFEAERKRSKGSVCSRQNPSKGDAVSTKSKRQSEKLPLKKPVVEATPDDVKDLKSLEETKDVSPETEPDKDCRKSSKGKNTMDRQSAKRGASSASPRITIKLVAKKKMKTITEPLKKFAKKLKIKGIQDQPKAKNIQGDQISSAHVKLKTEPHEDKQGTEDKGGGTLPTRRRGRSASKTSEPVSQPSAKVVVDDQKLKERKSADKFDTVKESITMEPKTNARKLKHKDKVTEQVSEVNQLITRRSNRVINPLTKKVSEFAAEPENLSKSDAILGESKPEVPPMAETKPSMRSDGRRQSKRLNKEVTLTENHGSQQSRDSLDTRIQSLKLMKVRNPKYDAQASNNNSTRKKKHRKKFIWTLTLVKAERPTQGAVNTVKVTDKAVGEVDLSAICDPVVDQSLRTVDQKSKQDNSAPQESKSLDNIVKGSQNKAEVSTEDHSTLQVEVEVDHIHETPSQEITKMDSGKVPPLQIKKVSSPGKHKSSKPSFLIQQVSPVSEKKEDVLKDQVSPVFEKKEDVLKDQVSPVSEKKEDVLKDQVSPVSEKKEEVLKDQVSPLSEKKEEVLKDQVSPVSEKKEDVPNDLSEVNEDKSSYVDTEASPTRRLRRRRLSLDSPQPKSVAHKRVVTQKRRLRTSPKDKDTPQVHVEDSAQASAEESNSHGLPKNSFQDLAGEPLEVISENTTEVPEKETSKVPDNSSQLPVEVTQQKVEDQVELQIKETKPLPVPSKPRRCRNNKLGKKRSVRGRKLLSLLKLLSAQS